MNIYLFEFERESLNSFVKQNNAVDIGAQMETMTQPTRRISEFNIVVDLTNHYCYSEICIRPVVLFRHLYSTRVWFQTNNCWISICFGLVRSAVSVGCFYLDVAFPPWIFVRNSVFCKLSKSPKHILLFSFQISILSFLKSQQKFIRFLYSFDWRGMTLFYLEIYPFAVLLMDLYSANVSVPTNN